MLDHVGVNVSDLAAARSFYSAALEPLGIKPIMEFEGIACGFGDDQKPYFWIAQRDPATPSAHVAFAAPDRATVDAFHAAALAAGADRQRRTRAPADLPRALLRRLRARPGRQQHRGRLPPARRLIV